MENVHTKTEYRKRDIPSHLLKYFKFKRDNRWILRNVIIWHKPNVMPSSVKDRFTVDFEPVFFFTKSKKYWFETQYEPYEGPLNRWGGDKFNLRVRDARRKEGQPQYRATDQEIENYKNYQGIVRDQREMRPNLGRNKRCVWKVPTHPFPEAHFATFPEKLIEPMIKAGCPEFICKKCGRAKEKIFERGEFIQTGGSRKKDTPGISEKAKLEGTGYHQPKLAGYTDCGCDHSDGWDKGMVLDPFMGSGTTAVVAQKLGRNYIGIELNPEYIEIAEGRLAQQTLFI